MGYLLLIGQTFDPERLIRVHSPAMIPVIHCC